MLRHVLFWYALDSAVTNGYDAGMNQPSIIGRNIKRLREEHGWTITELADRAGIFREHVSRYESGSRNPSLTTAAAIAQALGVTVNDLLAAESDSSGAKRNSTAKKRKKRG